MGIFDDWGISVEKYDGPTVANAKTTFKNQYLSDIILELLETAHIPCLLSLSNGQQAIGVWGQHHLRYLQKHRRATYISLKTTGKLNGYLANMDRPAEKMFVRLVQQMAECEGITEKLKELALMEWVRRMNNIADCAAEIVKSDLIYV